MGRNLTNHSESPVRDRGGSPRRRSPSQRERSPVRHRSSHRGSSPGREKERHSRHAKSPKHAQSESPVSRSPSPHTRRLMRARDEREVEKVKERDDKKNHIKRSDRGTHREKSHSPSPRTKRLGRTWDERDAEKVTEREHERNNGRGSDKGKLRERSGSPVSRSPSPRTKRLRRAQAGRDADKIIEKERERNHGRTSDRQPQSPISQSPSPHSRRLRRVEAEKEAAKLTEREREKNQGRASDKGMHRERGSDGETGNGRRERRDRDMDRERKERKLGRDETSNKSSITRHDRSTSPLDPPHRSRHRSRSPQSADGGRARHEVTDARGDEDRIDDDSLAKMQAAEEALQAKEKEKPSFELSGKLAAETNRFRGVTLLFNEPPDARKPNVRWRLYVFKGGEVLKEPLYIHRQSCYLFGRERRVADIPTDHPSCSKQHAVIQFRQVEKEQPDGMLSKQTRPYLMDLGSTNKTYLNENPIEPQRYYELFEKDTIKFGNSSREYVLLHENSVD
ncbi:FHA domain-containing protein DDL [Melia azedarach]|uniref:FHA domain-containing protein DDL n=1 Tax=Melia azedarach TaxID=155640 RepID=A0ACC1XV85_MELAZ|nr:FHA domain-containing protein DDL [Melia azedarach]